VCFGTIGVPDGKGYTNIYSNTATFAALKSDGSIASWGSGATFLLFFLLFFASNLPIKPLEQVKIARLMLEIDCPAHQHEQKICSYGFSLEDDNHYNEFQSDSNATNDNTVKVTNKNLKAIINKKLTALNLPGSQWVGFNTVSNKNTLSFGVNIGFKFSKLPWIVNECVGAHLTCTGKAGCFAVADFWKEIGSMSKTDALVQLEKFFYQGLEHKGVQLPAVINFTHNKLSI
jgi:hypothetical protein